MVSIANEEARRCLCILSAIELRERFSEVLEWTRTNEIYGPGELSLIRRDINSLIGDDLRRYREYCSFDTKDIGGTMRQVRNNIISGNINDKKIRQDIHRSVEKALISFKNSVKCRENIRMVPK